MQKTIDNDILFDDVAILENRFGNDYSKTNRELVSSGDCANYTGSEDDDTFNLAVAI
jgi:hypothetical protein